jgi:hypothetical protein
MNHNIDHQCVKKNPHEERQKSYRVFCVMERGNEMRFQKKLVMDLCALYGSISIWLFM